MLCLINKLIGLLVWMRVVSLPAVLEAPLESADLPSRTWKLAHAMSRCTHVFVRTHIVYTLLYKHAHKHTHIHTHTYAVHLLTQSHSIQSLLTHRRSQNWLRFQGVPRANSNHTEGNRKFLFAYCPNNNPKAVWDEVTSQPHPKSIE